MVDTVVIGSGPAGVSAALYILRAGYSVSVIGMDYGALEKAEKIENFYGLVEPISGKDLADIGRKQIKSLGGEMIDDEVVGLMWDNNFTVILNSREVHAKSIVIATGSSRKKPELKNIDSFESRGVSYCAVCDAFFYKEKNVALLGNGKYAVHELNELRNIVGHVTLITGGNGVEADFPSDIDIIDKKVTKLYGGDRLEGIIFDDGNKLEVSGLFIALGTAGGNDLAKKLGLEIQNNKIMVDDNMMTDIPGVFSAGDCIGGIMQISTAVGEGATAGISVIKFLRTGI